MVIYSETFYYSKSLKRYAKAYLDKLPKKIDGLLTIGSSGCSIAAAMLSLSDRDLYHVSVRKSSDENSHYNKYAGRILAKNYAIVDDFAETGDTVINLLRWAEKNGLQVSCVLLDTFGSEIENNRLNKDFPSVKIIELKKRN